MTGNGGRIYVTGAAGMIGSNICRALVSAGASVIAIDSLWRGARRNVADLEQNPQFEFRHADIVSDRDWYFEMNEGSVVIHTADIVAGIGYVFANEWSVFQKNVLINTQVARIINERQPQRFIYLGTACSYPQKLQRSVDASVLSERVKFPADPESGYGWSKLMGEVEFRLAVKGTATRFTVLDLHNVYGWPCIYRESTSQVIPSLIYRALTCRTASCPCGEMESRVALLCTSQNVVSAVQSTLSYSGTEPTFMIGPDHCTTIGEVARLIASHPRIKIDEIVYDTSKPTGDIGRFADASVALRELKWSPRVNFEVGLSELIDRIIDDAG